MDYMINPVKMGGLVKEVTNGNVKIHLYGRLGVITVHESMIIGDKPVKKGQDLEFYFSYVQIVEDPYDYDDSDMVTSHEPQPCLLGGKVTEVNDTAISVGIMNRRGTISVPRRWVFTPVELQKEQNVEFYFSCMKIVGKRDALIESI